MKKSIFSMAITLFAALFIVSCAGPSVELVDPNSDTAAPVAGLDYRDFEMAAAEILDSLFSSGALVKPTGGRYVVAIGRIKNDTSQYIDTDQLVKKIRTNMLRSGKAVITTAVGADGPEDQFARDTRQLRNDAEFNQATTAQQGTLIAPDLSLSGKILERQLYMDRGRVQIEYYFQLTITDITTGLAFWEDEVKIIKRRR